ncbi:MAG: NUDIX hydrolase [Chloroflexaceae bacterium]|jgi:8-oxo-dGTP pyrophosphatase MutT (NUDIX family)|nr:NUDIX hydrolase [Chloroflexaceae bacterium]
MTSRHPRSASTHRTAYSAGGVIYRIQDGRLEVALIATDRGGRWGLPKGHVHRGETAEAAAIREVAEETGLDGEIVQHLATIEYWFRASSTRIHKYVDLFLLRYTGGILTPQIGEVDDVQWFGLEQAVRLVSFDRERDVLAQVQALWEQQTQVW